MKYQNDDISNEELLATIRRERQIIEQLVEENKRALAESKEVLAETRALHSEIIMMSKTLQAENYRLAGNLGQVNDSFIIEPTEETMAPDRFM